MAIFDEAENMNESRADWAEAGLDEFRGIVYKGNRNLEDDETAFGDLMCDLRHLADRYGLSWTDMVARADENYLEELQEAPKARFRPPALSRDAEVVAKSFWGGAGLTMTTMTLKFQRPNIIHPRMAIALDELTDAGMLARTDDPRGPREWKPTDRMEAAAKFNRPKKGEDCPPFTTE